MSRKILSAFLSTLNTSIIVICPVTLLTFDMLPLSAVAMNSSTSAERECAKPVNQYIVLADLNLIRAIQDMLNDNATGALDQISLAKEQLNNADRHIRSCS